MSAEQSSENYMLSDRAVTLHHEAVVIDGMAGSAFKFEPLCRGGLTACNITLAGGNPKFREVVKAVAEYLDLLDYASDRLALVSHVSDIANCKSQGKLGLIFGLQGSGALEGDVGLTRVLHQLGIRIMQLTYSEQNELGCGCLEPNDSGLTYFGRQAVREMNRLGIVVDLSHAGYKTSMDAMSRSNDPVIISHANPRALCNNPRCISDEQIRGVAETGGVIGVSPYAAFCEVEENTWPDISAYIKHLTYVADLVGIDHVAIGTDMFEDRQELDWIINWQLKYEEAYRPYSSFATRHVQGLSSLEYAPRITEHLLRAGYTPVEVRKILGENLKRVFTKVWR